MNWVLGPYSPVAFPVVLLAIPEKKICPPSNVKENRKTEKRIRDLEIDNWKAGSVLALYKRKPKVIFYDNVSKLDTIVGWFQEPVLV